MALDKKWRYILHKLSQLSRINLIIKKNHPYKKNGLTRTFLFTEIASLHSVLMWSFAVGIKWSTPHVRCDEIQPKSHRMCELSSYCKVSTAICTHAFRQWCFNQNMHHSQLRHWHGPVPELLAFQARLPHERVRGLPVHQLRGRSDWDELYMCAASL